MNTHLLATEIVRKVRDSMQDSSLNQATVVEGMIREAMLEDRLIHLREEFEGKTAQFFLDPKIPD